VPPTATPIPPAEIQYSQGASDTEVLVSNSAAQSGPFAVVGEPFNKGIQAYFEMINEGGGVDGRKIIFKQFSDDECDPVKASAALQEMVEDEKVFALVGQLGTAAVGAIIGDMKDYGIPAVYFATGIGSLYATGAKSNDEGFNLFPVQPLYATEGRVLLGFAKGKFGAAKVGVIYTNDDAGTDLLKGIKDQASDLGGVEIVEEQVAAGAPDVSAAVTSIKNAGVDIVIVASIQATFPTIVKELAAQSVNKDAITTYVNNSLDMSTQVVDDIKDKFDVYSTDWLSLADLDSVNQFVEWVGKQGEAYVANSFSMAGWIAGATFTEGLKRLEGKDITWESYMAAMEESPITLPFGAGVDYADGNRWGTQAMSLSKVVPVSEAATAGWEEAYPMTNLSDLVK
jgi:ABC-type branched-subunit amino acid transport system substrate-binding protein